MEWKLNFGISSYEDAAQFNILRQKPRICIWLHQHFANNMQQTIEISLGISWERSWRSTPARCWAAFACAWALRSSTCTVEEAQNGTEGIAKPEHKERSAESGWFPKINQIDRPITHSWKERKNAKSNKLKLNNRTLFLQTAKPESPGLGFSKNNVGIRGLCLHMPKELGGAQSLECGKCWKYQPNSIVILKRRTFNAMRSDWYLLWWRWDWCLVFFASRWWDPALCTSGLEMTKRIFLPWWKRFQKREMRVDVTLLMSIDQLDRNII